MGNPVQFDLLIVEKVINSRAAATILASCRKARQKHDFPVQNLWNLNS